MKVQLKNGEVHKIASIMVIDEHGKGSYISKDWNWNWDQSNLTYLPIDTIESFLEEDSGSDFRDGYELGLLHGASNKEKELIAEGILEPDEFDDDEEEFDVELLFDLYESDI